MKTNYRASDPLTMIPGIGKSIAQDLRDIGIFSVSDLRYREPEALYRLSNKHAGCVQDKCLLYVFRCAVYYARGGRDPERLKWWHWKNHNGRSRKGIGTTSTGSKQGVTMKNSREAP